MPLTRSSARTFFVLCDGVQFLIYETLAGPDPAPLVELNESELDQRFHEIENILSPENLAKNCHVKHDKGLKLCEGLGSSVEIQSGDYNIRDWGYRFLVAGNDVTELLKANISQLSELDKVFEHFQNDFLLRVSGGSAKRSADGRISTPQTLAGVTQSNEKLMGLLDLREITLSTNDKFLSLDSSVPTVFEATSDFSIEKGMGVLPLFGEASESEAGVNCAVLMIVRAHKHGDAILCQYGAIADYWMTLPKIGPVKLEVDMTGELELKLVSSDRDAPGV